ncbi:MAG TPA: ABC transporter ATP-binding protein [Acidimicrobiia bacterium]|nr:ABC transporter ATP-binding protein [Acidimicrobiia bacterium]
MSVPRLTLDNVTVEYGRLRAVDRVSLSAFPGETIALLGANGAGKSSLLQAVAGAVPPREGRVLLDGQDVSRLPVHRRARSGLVLVPEGRGLLPRLSVVENMRLAAFGVGLRRNSAEVRTRIDEAISPFPVLARRLNQPAGTLSGGEQQMLVIARALVTRPVALLLDEVSLGLAPTVVEQIYAILKDLAAEGLTMVLVEQYANLALGMAQRAFVLRKGQIVFAGSGAEGLADPEALHRAYLGSEQGTATASCAVESPPSPAAC